MKGNGKMMCLMEMEFIMIIRQSHILKDYLKKALKKM